MNLNFKYVLKFIFLFTLALAIIYGFLRLVLKIDPDTAITTAILFGTGILTISAIADRLTNPHQNTNHEEQSDQP